ncbi:DUF2835 domain-containing protein [Shewanella gaetbuli]
MQFVLNINISYDDFLPYYQGISESVLTNDIHGRQLQIHAKYFKPFLTPVGIKGQFILELDEEGKYKSLIKLE